MIFKTQSKLLMITLFGIVSFTINAQVIKIKKKAKEEQNVLNAITKITEAYENKDIDAVMACYEPKATIIFEPESSISDKNVSRKMFNEMSLANPKFTYSEHDIFITGNIATYIAPWKMITKTTDGKEIKHNGLSIAVLRKQENGKWLIILDNPYGSFLLNK